MMMTKRNELAPYRLYPSCCVWTVETVDSIQELNTYVHTYSSPRSTVLVFGLDQAITAAPCYWFVTLFLTEHLNMYLIAFFSKSTFASV